MFACIIGSQRAQVRQKLSYFTKLPSWYRTLDSLPCMNTFQTIDLDSNWTHNGILAQMCILTRTTVQNIYVFWRSMYFSEICIFFTMCIFIQIKYFCWKYAILFKKCIFVQKSILVQNVYFVQICILFKPLLEPFILIQNMKLDTQYVVAFKICIFVQSMNFCPK